jgi:hypothetical protein
MEPRLIAASAAIRSIIEGLPVAVPTSSQGLCKDCISQWSNLMKWQGLHDA